MPAGTYVLRAQGFQRTGHADAAEAEFEAGNAEITARLCMNQARQALTNLFAEQQAESCYPAPESGQEPDYPTTTGNYVPNGMAGAEAYLARGLYDNAMDYTLAEDGDLTLGVENTTRRPGGWTLFDNFRLQYRPATLHLDEDSESLPVTRNTYAARVTTNRTLPADRWSTLCLPFDLSAEQLREAGIAEVRVLTGVTVEGDMVFADFTDALAMEAGKPYLVKATMETTLEFGDVLVVADESEPLEADGVCMQGTYAPAQLEGVYYINADSFYYADVPVASKGFRAFIRLNEAAGVKCLGIRPDGRPTTVAPVATAPGETRVDVYTLNGVRVKSGVKASAALEGLRKGIYLVNGKKVIK